MAVTWRRDSGCGSQLETLRTDTAASRMRSGVLDFFTEEHEMWCDRVLDLIRQPLGGGTQPTHPQRSRFEEHYASLVGGNRAAEGWLREMVSNVKGRLEMLADCLESASGAPS